jgi:magnesium-transporting ATPase (P-type)
MEIKKKTKKKLPLQRVKILLYFSFIFFLAVMAMGWLGHLQWPNPYKFLFFFLFSHSGRGGLATSKGQTLTIFFFSLVLAVGVVRPPPSLPRG